MGLKWFLVVAMNEPQIISVQRAGEILGCYDLTRLPMKVNADERGTGTLVLWQDPNWYLHRPSALRVDQIPKTDDLDDDAWVADEEELHEKCGQAGLNDLLLSLAPILASPLILQSAVFDTGGGFTSAKQWTVRPSASAVEFQEIIALGDDATTLSQMN